MKENKYIILLVALIVVYVFYEIQKPRPENWTPTYNFVDQDAFGGNALYQLSPALFKGEELRSYFKTLFELNEEDDPQNLLVIANQLAFNKEETELLLNWAHDGKTVLVAAQSFDGFLADTLSLNAREEAVFFSFSPKDISAALAGEVKERITWDQQVFDYPYLGALASFDRPNSEIKVLAKNGQNRPVLMKYPHGKGAIYLSSMPLAFTNYFTLLPETTTYTEGLMRLFPSEEVPLHIEYYQMGRLASGSQIRALLREPALRMATYVLMGVLLIFLVFQAKRRQRIIPTLAGNPNLSLEFVSTLGSLYYRQLDHQNLLKKRILYWKEYVRTHYYLNTSHLDEAFVNELANKSGKSKAAIQALTNRVVVVEEGKNLTGENVMKDLENRLNEFYGIS